MTKLFYIGIRRRLRISDINQISKEDIRDGLFTEIGGNLVFIILIIALSTLHFEGLNPDMENENIFERRGKLLIPLVILFFGLLIPLYLFFRKRVLKYHEYLLERQLDINKKDYILYRIYFISLCSLVFIVPLILFLRMLG